MSGIDPAECGEKLPGFHLEIEWQAGGLQECFLYLDFGFVVVIQLENDIREALEIRVHRAIECKFEIAGVKSALLRVVVPHLDMIKVARA